MPAVTDIFSNPRDTAPDPLLERLRSVTIGEYEIRGELGRGGMAVVYLAKDIRLERTVAIKVMLPELLRTDGMAERFLLEARISARLQHPNIIIVHDVRQREEIIYFVMSLVDGCGLDEIARAGTMLPIDDVRWVLMQAAQALSYANGEGIVHRDVKPGNILLTVKGDVLVTDFGIAKVVANNSRSMGATIIGTPLYMSPEQVTGQRVSEASDQYSLGITAYALLAGSPPFSGDLSLFDLQTAHVRTRPVPLLTRRPDCPPALAAAVMRMLEKRAESRWPSLQELVPVLGEGLPHDGLEIKRRLGTLARSLRDANTQRSSVIAIETPVTPRPGVTARPKPAMIVVSPPSATLYTAAQLELSAKVMTSAGASIDDAIVAWTSSDPEIATVSPTGVLLAVGPGTARIRAAIGSVSEDALVTVRLSPITRLELAADSLSLMAGDTIRPAVRAIDAQGNVRADAACSWLSRNSGVVQVVGAGELRGVAPGEAAIEVATGTVRATLRVQVTPRPAATVRVLADSPTIEYGDAIALRAEALDDRGARVAAPRVTWSSDAPHVVHVDSTGTAIGLSPGRATIAALIDGVSGMLPMQVVEAPIASIALTVEPQALEPGDAAHVAISVTDASGRPRSEDGIIIESDNERVVRLLDDGCTLMAVAAGDARISARLVAATAGDVVVAEPVSVTVRLPVVARVLVSSLSLEIEIGAVVALTARCQDARRRPLAVAVLSWQSLDPTIITVDERGEARAVGVGQTTIRVTALGAHESSASEDIAVDVRRASIASVRLSTSSARVVVGAAQPIQAVCTDSTGAPVADRAPTFSSSDPRIARVDQSGVVEAMAPGKATISATLDGQRGELVMHVDLAPVTAIRIVLPNDVVTVGDPVRCRIEASDARGESREVDVRWSVAPAALASIATDGTLMPLGIGTFVVIADCAGLRDERTIEAKPPVIARVSIDAAVSRLRVGAQATLKARALRADGRVIDGVPLTWSVSDGGYVELTPDGRVTARRPGTAVVSVLAGAQRAQVDVVVPEPRAPMNRTWLYASGALAVVAVAVFAWSRRDTTATPQAVVTTPAILPDTAPGVAAAPAPQPTDSAAAASPESTTDVKAADGITIEYPRPSNGLKVGDRLQLSARSRNGGTALAGVRWSVAPSGVAAVDRNGLLVALQAGTVRVTARSASDSVGVRIAVLAKPSTQDFGPLVTSPDLEQARRAADEESARRVTDSVRAATEARLAAEASAAREREAQRLRDSASEAARNEAARRPVVDVTTTAPTDVEVRSAIDRFVNRFKNGEFRSAELSELLKPGRGVSVVIERMPGEQPRITRNGASIDVAMSLKVDRISTAPTVKRRVTFKLSGQGAGAAFELRPVGSPAVEKR